MDTIHRQLIHMIAQAVEESTETAEKLVFDDLFAAVTPEAVKVMKDSLASSAQAMLKERRKLARGFERRNYLRWAQPFDLLEAHIVICTEAGEMFNKAYRSVAVKKNDLVFDLVVRHHARACHIGNEICCLLKSGYPDAAHARWRALHEVAVTAMFIAKHGQECAERFYFHEVIDSYDGMIEHNKYEDRLRAKGPSPEEIRQCKIQYDKLIAKYGQRFGDHYGWAATFFPNRSRVTSDLSLISRCDILCHGRRLSSSLRRNNHDYQRVAQAVF